MLKCISSEAKIRLRAILRVQFRYSGLRNESYILISMTIFTSKKYLYPLRALVVFATPGSAKGVRGGERI